MECSPLEATEPLKLTFVVVVFITEYNIPQVNVVTSLSTFKLMQRIYRSSMIFIQLSHNILNNAGVFEVAFVEVCDCFIDLLILDNKTNVHLGSTLTHHLNLDTASIEHTESSSQNF